MSRFDELVTVAGRVFDSWAADETSDADVMPALVRELLVVLSHPDPAMIEAGMDHSVDAEIVASVYRAMMAQVLREAPDVP